ncbi:class I SAM-dependent methyltransferase [Yoonia sediminilitoris]|uniref:Methyltransferase family protein n=1 Tax=Yoonia sediminilitoris TaxID=1286148 RepID=A0A2T6KFZ2_9RHOB|nr:class I SAM-dependent methyltransferase [Yoonia sediminilitoris]PUB14249.1 methyltransferase family protein [Yoonia sediminilitoris]RCW95180.1 methyltransferase family protein [Yoonia sediminilitoris]
MQVIDWDAMSAPWLKSERGLEAAHQTVLDGLMHRAGLETGQRVLDIGCGTGASLLAAAEVVGMTGQVTGVDIAPPLAARARDRAPETVDVLVGDAGTLEHDRAFDAAISLFGTMFFTDTPAAFATIRKALKPGAKFVFSAWGSPPRNPWFGIPRSSVEAHVGELPKPDPTAPGPFRFADAQAIVEALSSVGWDVSVDSEALLLRTGQDSNGLAEMHLNIAEALMLANHDLSQNDRDAIRENLRVGFSNHQGEDGVQVPAEVHFFTAIAVD